MAQFRPKKVTQEYLQYSKRFFELYQVFINNFLYQTLLIFPLYILLTRNCSYFGLEVSTQFWTRKLHKKNWQVFMYNFLCQSIRILFTRRISNIYKYFLNYIRFSYIIFVSKWLHISINQKMALFLFFFTYFGMHQYHHLGGHAAGINYFLISFLHALCCLYLLHQAISLTRIKFSGLSS